MSVTLRLAVLGGSGASTPELMDAIAGWPGGADRRPALEVVLQGRSAQKLELVAGALRSRLPASVSGVSVSTETSLDRALEGADVVLIQVRVGGLDARIFDETFPRAFGIPGEETMGPGGFADALRTVPALADTWDRLAELAGDAFIINLTNPSGIVTQAATAHTGLRFVSVCDGPVTFVEGIVRATGRDAAAIRLDYAGMNHCGFWVDPQAEVLVSALVATSGQDAEDVEALRALPTPYVRFYVHPDRQLESQLATPESRAQALKRMEAQMLDQYASQVESAQQTRRGALWYRVSIVPLIDAIVHGGDDTVILGLPNDGAVPWAPDDAIVELPTDIQQGGALSRRPAVELPDRVVDLLRQHARFEALTAHALAGARSRDDLAGRRPALVEALAANPMVESDDLAERLVDEILARSPS
jgi:6-phospho-beta-glucosidase